MSFLCKPYIKKYENELNKSNQQLRELEDKYENELKERNQQLRELRNKYEGKFYELEHKYKELQHKYDQQNKELKMTKRNDYRCQYMEDTIRNNHHNEIQLRTEMEYYKHKYDILQKDYRRMYEDMNNRYYSLYKELQKQQKTNNELKILLQTYTSQRYNDTQYHNLMY